MPHPVKGEATECGPAQPMCKGNPLCGPADAHHHPCHETRKAGLSLLQSLQKYLLLLGIPGLLAISFFDSAALPILMGPDAVVLLLAWQQPMQILIIILAAALGSTLGSLVPLPGWPGRWGSGAEPLQRREESVGEGKTRPQRLHCGPRRRNGAAAVSHQAGDSRSRRISSPPHSFLPTASWPGACFATACSPIWGHGSEIVPPMW